MEISYNNLVVLIVIITIRLGTAVAQWLSCCAISRKVAGSIFH